MMLSEMVTNDGVQAINVIDMSCPEGQSEAAEVNINGLLNFHG